MNARPLRGLLAWLFLLLALAGCSPQAAFDKSVPRNEAELSHRLIASLAARDFAAVEAQLHPSLRGPGLAARLEEIARVPPAAQPLSVTTIAAQTVVSGQATRYDLTFEYAYPGAWVAANTVLERRDGKLTFQGLHVTPIRESLVALNRFTFEGKGVLHYLVFGLAIAIPLLVAGALVACARSPQVRRKWLWMAFIAIGVCQLGFDWTTGAVHFQPLALSLLGAGFFKAGPAAPFIFTLGFPLGAVVFLARRRALRAPSA